MKECGGFPGPGDDEHRVQMNPMMEYIGNNDEHTDSMFNHFKKTHKKNYSGNKEHDIRKHTFRQNVRCVLLLYRFVFISNCFINIVVVVIL